MPGVRARPSLNSDMRLEEAIDFGAPPGGSMAGVVSKQDAGCAANLLMRWLADAAAEEISHHRRVCDALCRLEFDLVRNQGGTGGFATDYVCGAALPPRVSRA